MEKINRSYTFVILILLLVFGPGLQGCYSDRRSIKDQNWQQKQQQMVKILRLYGIKDPKILAAMAKVKRHLFIPQSHRGRYNPYGTHPCPIGFNQPISPPYIVAYMTENLNLKPGEKVLEIGSGSGYQAAILAELGVRFYSVEIIKALADHARDVLKSLGYNKVNILHGDGYQGWPEYAPYNAIIVTCAPGEIPQNLIEQLADRGRMIIPVGKFKQRLIILYKKDGKIKKTSDLDVRFVPMVHQKKGKE